jgi:hypothetical protein
MLARWAVIARKRGNVGGRFESTCPTIRPSECWQALNGTALAAAQRSEHTQAPLEAEIPQNHLLKWAVQPPNRHRQIAVSIFHVQLFWRRLHMTRKRSKTGGLKLKARFGLPISINQARVPLRATCRLGDGAGARRMWSLPRRNAPRPHLRAPARFRAR